MRGVFVKMGLLGLALTLIVTLIFTWGCGSSEPHPERPHHTLDGRFRNPTPDANRRKSLGSFMWMRMRTDWVDTSEGDEVPRVRPDLERLQRAGAELVTWVGHSCFLVQSGGVNLLTDPVFSERASPVSFAGPERYTPPALKIEELPKVHVVVISHNHYDHLDLESIRAIDERSAPLWLVPLKNGELLTDEGVSPERVVELDWWQTHRVKLGAQGTRAELTATPAQHWSARGLFDRNEMLWSSWAIKVGDLTVYFGGDTGYRDGLFTEIGERLGPFSLGLIPIGAYAPREFMRQAHVNPEEAVRIHQDVGARRSLGAHWGTFPLTAEPVMDPPRRLKEALKARKLDPQSFIAPVLGHAYALNRGASVWPRDKERIKEESQEGSREETREASKGHPQELTEPGASSP